MVIAWHYGASAIHPPPGTWKAYVLAIFSLSWSGVDLFLFIIPDF